MNVKIFRMLLIFAMFGAIAHSQNPSNPYSDLNYLDDNKISDAANKPITDFMNPNLGIGVEGIPECSTTSTNIPTILNSHMINTILAMFIVALGIGLLYMAGNFFQSPQAIALATQELNEFVIMLTIVALFWTIMASPSFFGIDLYKEAMGYSYKMLNKVSEVTSVLTTANIILNSIYTLYVPLGPIRQAMTIQLGPVFRPAIDAVSFCLQFLITTYGEWMVFIFIFCFIQKWMLPFFFPLGLLLRAFPQTRGGGNALIALSIALATIYPFMFYVDSQIFDVQFPQSRSVFQEPIGYFKSAVNALYSTLTVGGAIAIFFAFSFIYVTPFMVSAIVLTNYMLFDVAIQVLHLVVMFSIILPIMNIFITLAFAREISRMLGTELNISAFAKLI